MTRSPVLIRLVAVALVASGSAACATAGASPGASTAPPVVTPTVAPTLAPLTTAPAPEPTATALGPTATPDPPDASLGEPPVATLAAEGGDPVAGSLGSFTWGDGGSDSPWLPGARVLVGSGEPLRVELAPTEPVKDWAAKRVAAGSTDGVGAVAVAAGGTTPIAFPAPAPGSWSVQVTITFGDELGAATYYWTITVE